MLTKHVSRFLVLVLFCASGISTLAKTPADLENENRSSRTAIEYAISIKPDAQPDDRLRAEMQKLLADARAGKVTPAARPQIQPAKSNSLSKKTKIAIGVGIAAVVIAIIVKHQVDNLFSCKSRCVGI